MRRKVVATAISVMFFALSITITTTTVGDWVPADGHKMHWPQTPDLTATGVAVDMPLMRLRADDFRCSETGYITGIHIWGSFETDILPPAGPDGLVFHLSIWEDIPAAPGTPYYFSQPGQMLWTKTFTPGTYTIDLAADNTSEGWYDPDTNVYAANDHDKVYLYNFDIPTSQAFLQEEGIIYWLGVRQYFTSGGESFGWKSTDTTLQWNDNAVWMSASGWLPLEYPTDHIFAGQPLDFAFVIEGVPVPTITPIPWYFTPKNLNVASSGKWVMGKIAPPEGYEADDFDISTIMLEYQIPVAWGKVVGNELLLKFDRSELEDMIMGGPPPLRPAEFRLSGRLSDGTVFVGYSDTITFTGLE